MNMLAIGKWLWFGAAMAAWAFGWYDQLHSALTIWAVFFVGDYLHSHPAPTTTKETEEG